MEEFDTQARRAKRIVWGAFILAFALAAGLRFERTWVAADEIGDTARAVSVLLAPEGTTPAAAAEKAVSDLYESEKAGDSAAAASYRELVLLLAHHMSTARAAKTGEPRAADSPGSAPEQAARPAPEPAAKAATGSRPEPVAEPAAGAAQAADAVAEHYRREARASLFASVTVVSLVHLGILIIFPASFAASIERARRHLARFSTTKPTTFWNDVHFERYKVLLAEESDWLVGRRLGFALIASFGLVFLFAPAGLQASAIGEFVRLHAIPGVASHPFWFTESGQASPFVIGLAGFLLYALITLAQRAYARDVSSRLFLSLWNRGLTVVVLSLVLTAIDEGANISKALIFVAGVFPQAGLQAIAKIAQSGTDRLAQLETRDLSTLPEIDPQKARSLEELGIRTIADLAQEDLPGWLITQSRVHPRILVKAVDRALLQHQLGELAAKLAEVPVFTASELVLHALGDRAYAAPPPAPGQAPARGLAKTLSDQEVMQRYNALDKLLGTSDIELHVGLLKANANLAYIMKNRLAYGDL